MSAKSGGPAESAVAHTPVSTAPQRRTARVVSVVLALVLLAYVATPQAAPATAELPYNNEALVLFVTAFYTSLLVLRWISPDAAWWVGIIQGIAALALALLIAGMTATIAPLIAGGYLIFLASRAFWANVDRARGIA